MKKNKWLLSAILISSVFFALEAENEKENEKICYQCAKIEKKTDMNGSSFLDAEWAKLPFISGFIKYHRAPVVIRHLQTEAKMADDDNCLYLTIRIK